MQIISMSFERLRNGRIEALAQVALNIADGNKQRNF